MRLSRLRRITGFRVFRDFTWPQDLHEFGQFNAIYGWNGAGKSTLAAMLRHLQTRTAPAGATLELEFDGRTRVAGADLPTSPNMPPVRVFDRVFADRVVAAAQSGMDHIYYFGEDSVQKQEEIAKLKAELKVAEQVAADKAKASRTAVDDLDKFCVDAARQIKELLLGSTSHANYNKARFRQAVELLDEGVARAALLTDEEKKDKQRQRNSGPKSGIATVAAPAIDIVALTERTSAVLAESVVSKVIADLAANPAVAQWVQRGLQLHTGEHDHTHCQFCTQPFTTARRTELEAHFNDEFTRFQGRLDGLLRELRLAQESIGTASFPDPARFYDHLTAQAGNAVAAAKAVLDAVATRLILLQVALEPKKANPFQPLELPDLPVASVPKQRAVEDAVQAINDIIDEHAATTTNLQDRITEACNVLELCAVAEAHGGFVRLTDDAKRLAEEAQAAADKAGELKGKILVLEREIVEHRRPAEELDAELRAYLGRDELRFEVRDTGYVLMRSGSPVQHLSEGEKTAIGFLYFLKSLQDKDFDISGGIVVIDDPVSSLDANGLFSAFSYMKERTKDCGQLFILTHNFAFFRQVKNWFHHLPGQGKADVSKRPARFFLVRTEVDGATAVRRGCVAAIDPLLEQYESEYHYLFKLVHTEANKQGAGGALEVYYGMPNVARRLLESFLAFRYPDKAKDLHAVLQRVPFDQERKTRILRFVHTYSHSDQIAEPQHDPYVLNATPQVLRDVLDLIQDQDPTHFASMAALVGHAESGE